MGTLSWWAKSKIVLWLSLCLLLFQTQTQLWRVLQLTLERVVDVRQEPNVVKMDNVHLAMQMVTVIALNYPMTIGLGTVRPMALDDPMTVAAPEVAAKTDAIYIVVGTAVAEAFSTASN